MRMGTDGHVGEVRREGEGRGRGKGGKGGGCLMGEVRREERDVDGKRGEGRGWMPCGRGEKEGKGEGGCHMGEVRREGKGGGEERKREGKTRKGGGERR